MTFFIDVVLLLRPHKPKRAQHAGELLLELPEFQSDGAAACDDDYVIAELQLRFEGAVALPQSAAYAVALNGVSEFSPDREAEAVYIPSVSKAVHRNGASGRAFPAVVQPSEFMILF